MPSPRGLYENAFAALERGDQKAALQMSIESARRGARRGDYTIAAGASFLAAQLITGVQAKARLHEQAVEFAMRSGNSEAIARCQLGLGEFLGTLGRWEAALPHLTESVYAARLGSHRELLLMALGYEGDAYRFLEQSAHAKGSYEQAIVLAEALSNDAGLLDNLLSLSGMFIARHEFDQAEPLLSRAAALSKATSNNVSLAECLFQVGDLAWIKGSTEEAARHFAGSRQAARSAGADLTYYNATLQLAKIRQQLGDGRQAIELCREALAGYAEIGEIGSRRQAVLTLASMYGFLGDRDLAIQMLSNLIDELKGNDNRRLRAQAELQLSIEFRAMNLLESALKVGQSARETFEDIGIGQQVGVALKEEARTLRQLKRIKEADEVFRRAQKYAEEARDDLLVADLILDHVQIAFDVAISAGVPTVSPKQIAAIHDSCQEALEIYHRERNMLGVANANALIGRLAFLERSVNAGVNLALMENTRRSVELYANTGNVRAYLNEMMWLAQMSFLFDDNDGAMALTEQILAVLEEQRTLLTSPFSRGEIIERWEQAYEFELIASLRGGELERAFECLLKARARMLQELLISDRNQAKQSSWDKLRLRNLGALAVSALNGSVETVSKYRAASRSYDEELALEQLRIHLPPEGPETLSRALELLRSLPGTIFLDLYAGHNAKGGFQVESTGIKSLAWDLNRKDQLIGPQVEAFAVAELGNSFELASRIQELWRSLSGSTEPPLADTVLVATHGDFRRLPLHAMPVLDKRWRRLRIAYVPSLSVMGRVDPVSQSLGKPRALLVGADANGPRGARREIEELGRLYEAAGGYARSCESAEEFERNQDEWDVIHVASHGWVEPSSPCGTGLLLRSEDGAPALIGIPDLQSLHVTARVVILSGCSTGATIGLGGQVEFLGLVSAFMSATGASAVVAPLWPVLDDVAYDVNLALHKALLDGHAIGDALSRSCIDVADARGLLRSVADPRPNAPKTPHPDLKSVIAFACFGYPDSRLVSAT